MQDFIVETDGRKFIDIVKVLPRRFKNGKRVIYKNFLNGMIEIYIKKAPGKAGHDSKKFMLNRLIELDELFFEGLGLWQGEGGKAKGLYFGNSSLELLLHFLKFVEFKLGLKREKFKVTVNSPNLNIPEDSINERWSEKLGIHFENFTRVCYDPRINQEYAQVYVNGIVLSELMKNLHEKLKPLILSNKKFTTSYLRGIFAAEGAVVTRSTGIPHHVDISSKDLELVDFLTKCFAKIGIKRGKFFYEKGAKFPIYGRENYVLLLKYGILRIVPTKEQKLEEALTNYKRNVEKGEIIEKRILKHLRSGPKTYDELAFLLKKGRSTIQSHYIPLLERKGLIKRVGKKGQAWLFDLSD